MNATEIIAMHMAERRDNINNRRSILIVDDNALERTILAGFLEDRFNIITAGGGAEALELLEQGHEHISAVVLDIVMPGMDGYTVIEKLRASKTLSHIPIIVSTCLDDDYAQEKAITCGANGFVMKPYNHRLLLNAIENAVRLMDSTAAIEQSKAEQQQKMLLDNLPGGSILCEFDGQTIRAVHISKNYWKLVGREPDDYTNRVIFDMIHPDDRDIIMQELRSAIRHNRTMEVDMRIRAANGSYLPFHSTANISQEPNGKHAIYACFLPISNEAVSIQQMLPIALSTVMSSIDDYSYVIDRDGRYICCSKSVAKLLGMESERDLYGMTDIDMFGEELGGEFLSNDRKIIESGEPIINRLEKIPQKDGSTVYVSTSIFPIRDALGNVLGQYGISHDVSREHSLDFELQTLLNTIPSGVIKYSADKGAQFEYINRNFVESLGYTRESFTEKFHNCFDEMIWHEDRAQAKAEIDRQEGGGEIGKFDYRVEAADGQLHWIHDEGIKITDSQGKSWYYVSLFDITEQREAQEKLRVSEEMNRLAMEQSGKTVSQFDVRSGTLSLPESIAPIFDMPHLLKNIPDDQIALGIISPETAHVYLRLFDEIISGQAYGEGTYQQISSLGWRWIETHYTTVFSDAGEPVSAIITFEDVTEQLEKELIYNKWQQSLAERPKDSYTLFRCNLSKNSHFDSCDGTLLDLDFSKGKGNLDALMEGYADKVHKEDRAKYLAFTNSDAMLAGYYRGTRAGSLEYREMGANNSQRWLLLSAELVEYPNSKDIELYLLYENINDSKLSELDTKKKAETDPLTGVLNRTAFMAKFEECIKTDKMHALLMVDIDDFKNVNDTYGHDAGDKVLKELTVQFRTVLRRDDLICRLGGDEFFILLKDIPNRKIAARKADQICRLDIPVCGTQESIHISVGIVLVPSDGSDFKTLYKKADVALYKKKAAGKNGYLFADETA